MVCVELDKGFTNEHGIKEPKFKILFRVEIPRGDFTYVNAINKIIELNDIYDFDWVTVDRGYGETQIELLKQYGIQNPQSGLLDKTLGYQFGEKVKVRDPHTGKADAKPLKPFMVTNSVNVFEKGKIVFHPGDDKMAEQFGAYAIKSISSSGLPTFTSENEHMLDAINLCLLTFEQKYGDLMKRVITSKAGILKPHALSGMESKNVKSRVPDTQSHTSLIQTSNGGLVIAPRRIKSKKSLKSFSRSKF